MCSSGCSPSKKEAFYILFLLSRLCLVSQFEIQRYSKVFEVSPSLLKGFRPSVSPRSCARRFNMIKYLCVNSIKDFFLLGPFRQKRFGGLKRGERVIFHTDKNKKSDRLMGSSRRPTRLFLDRAPPLFAVMECYYIFLLVLEYFHFLLQFMDNYGMFFFFFNRGTFMPQKAAIHNPQGP